MPLIRDTLVSSYGAGTTQEHLEMLQGCHLHPEQDYQDLCIKSFLQGKHFHLRRDVNKEMRSALRMWGELWRQVYFTDNANYNPTVDQVHLQWLSHTIEQLQHEMYLLSTSRRSRGYVATVQARKIEVPAVL